MVHPNIQLSFRITNQETSTTSINEEGPPSSKGYAADQRINNGTKVIEAVHKDKRSGK